MHAGLHGSDMMRQMYIKTHQDKTRLYSKRNLRGISNQNEKKEAKLMINAENGE